MAATVTWERLRELAGFRSGRGCGVSFYVGLDPSVAPTAADVETRVNALLAEGEKWESASRDHLSAEQRRGVRADLERIRRWFDDEFVRDGVRGVAVFASGPDGVWTPLMLGEPVPDGVAISSRFHLAPLVSLAGRVADALVAVVGRERGEVLRLRDGRLREVADLTEEQPGQHDQGGWSQARYQRHIDALVAEHLRVVAETLNRSVRRAHGVPVVVVCAEEMRSEFAELLSQEARDALAGWTNTEAHAGHPEVLAAVRPVLEQWGLAQEAAALDRWREEAGRDGRAAAGWDETLQAASDGRVELLLFQPDVSREAWQCPDCGRGSTQSGACPLDGAQMERRDSGLDVAVHQTLVHGGTARAVEDSRDLEPVEGIGALLRF